MDIDLVLGSSIDRAKLSAAAPSPGAILAASPLLAIESVIRRLGPSGRLGRLRVFDLLSKGGAPSIATSQLARLKSLFEPTGRLEILCPPSPPAGPIPIPYPHTAATGMSGFSGGFSGFGGSTTSGFNSLHLSTLLNVPVAVRSL